MSKSATLTVRVGIRYVVPRECSIESLLQSFQHPSWVSFVLQTFGPKLHSAVPAMPGFLDDAQEFKGDKSRCSVCLSDDGAQVQLPCGHAFHQACVQTWFERKSTCPVCRYQVPTLLESGRYGVCSMTSALVLPDHFQGQSQNSVIAAMLPEGLTVRVVVQTQLKQLQSDVTRTNNVCVVNAAWVHSNRQSIRHEQTGLSDVRQGDQVRKRQREEEMEVSAKRQHQRLC